MIQIFLIQDLHSLLLEESEDKFFLVNLLCLCGGNADKAYRYTVIVQDTLLCWYISEVDEVCSRPDDVVGLQWTAHVRITYLQKCSCPTDIGRTNTLPGFLITSRDQLAELQEVLTAIVLMSLSCNMNTHQHL